MTEEKYAVQQALSRALSGLKNDPLLARRVIAKAEGETKMKKKLSAGLILAVILLIALIGTACAAFSSQVVAYFREHWSDEMADWLEDGKAAQIGETAKVGGVAVTLDEVVYRNHGLYAVGTIRALDEKDVLAPDTLMNQTNEFLQSEQGKALIERARKTGGRLLTARCIPSQVGVDGGNMLPTGGFGSSQTVNPDGSLTFSFHLTDGISITEGSRYRFALTAETQEWTLKGEEKNDAYQKDVMTVEFSPQIMKDDAEKTNVDLGAVKHSGDYAFIVPEEYKQTGMLPVYRAVKPDFTGIVAPDWFTDQRVAEESLPGNECFYLTEENDVLIVSEDSIYYYEYDGTYQETMNAMLKNPETAMYPADAISRQIAELAENAFYLPDVFSEGETPHRDALYRITKAEAIAKAENMLYRLGVTGFQCSYCLDMSVERIREMGGEMRKAIEEGRYLTDDGFAPDYEKAAETDEGYFLYYAPMGLKQVSRGRFKMILYVTARGIPYVNVQCAYLTGDILETPVALVAPESVLSKLDEEMSQARSPKTIEKINSIALLYTPARGRDGGMVMTPTWHVTFQQKSKNGLERESWADFNAVNGELLDAEFL